MLPPAFSLPLFVAAAVLAIAGQLFVLRDAVTGRTPASSTTAAGRAREVLWILLPAIALALVVFATWRALPANRGFSPARGTVPPVHAIPAGRLSPVAD